jgi:ABC-type Fe3+/spermidine/putrescine transport system ATPase subunit
VTEPPIILLDEPLSNLDAKLRESMRLELKRLQRETGVTAIYVTHDHHEGLYMADIAGAMFDGRIEKSGRPEELFTHPGTAKMAMFFGYNVISGGKHMNAFFPSDFEFSAKQADLGGTVTSAGFEGEFCRIHVLTDGGEKVQLTTPEKERVPKTGEHVNLRLTRVEELD